MPANHCLEVGLEKRVLRRCKSIKLGTSEEIRSFEKCAEKKIQCKVCSNLYARKNVRKLRNEMWKRLFSKGAVSAKSRR